jgi:hypothetical protein
LDIHVNLTNNSFYALFSNTKYNYRKQRGFVANTRREDEDKDQKEREKSSTKESTKGKQVYTVCNEIKKPILPK